MSIKKYMNKYQFALFQINWQFQTLFRALREGLLNNQDLIGLSSSSPSLGSPLPIQSLTFLDTCSENPMTRTTSETAYPLH